MGGFCLQECRNITQDKLNVMSNAAGSLVSIVHYLGSSVDSLALIAMYQ